MQQTEDPRGKGVGVGRRNRSTKELAQPTAPQSCPSLSHEFAHMCSPQDSAWGSRGHLENFQALPLPCSSFLELYPRSSHQANLGSSNSFLHSVRPPGWARGRVHLTPHPADSGSAKAPSCVSCFSGLSSSLSVVPNLQPLFQTFCLVLWFVMMTCSPGSPL